tara:strand:- start:612 stop:989 length:378 start_codon:yes stop_codon:yes gene_type:complete
MKDYTLKGYSTWKDIMNNSQITDIQDPVLEMEVDKYEFEDMYSDIVCELQGNDDVLESYIDYYFTVNPMKSYVLSFRSQKEKDEFYDIGLDKECVASLTEVCEGETEQEKKKRKRNEKDDYIVFE